MFKQVTAEKSVFKLEGRSTFVNTCKERRAIDLTIGKNKGVNPFP